MRISLKQLEILIPALKIAAEQYAREASSVKDAYKRVADIFVKQARDCDDLRKKLEDARENLYNQEI